MEDAPEQIMLKEIPAHETRNLWTMATQSVILRVGWVFKTESVIMPYVLDAISGSGWMRGMLPILSRIGQSVPPLMYADRLRSEPLKKVPLFLTAIGMALPFLILSVIWSQLESRRVWWMPPFFLLMYFLFFSATGLNQLTFGTLQGKLIRANRRGLLMGIGGVFGSFFAVSSALLWLGPWLSLPNDDGFTWVFLFNGSAFFLAGIVALFCLEEKEVLHRLNDHEAPRKDGSMVLLAPFRSAWRTFRDDSDFRKVAYVGMLFMSSLLIFPHYQWLGKERVGSESSDLIYWVIAQNISVGFYSPFLGRIADLAGNRLAIRMGVFTVSLTPLVAILFASGWIPHAEDWYWMTFVLLGLTPVIMHTLLNYTLELIEQERHPQYLSTMKIVFAVPFLFSPLIGFLMDMMPYQIPFVGVSLLLLASGVFTFRMVEPRHESTVQKPR